MTELAGMLMNEDTSPMHQPQQAVNRYDATKVLVFRTPVHPFSLLFFFPFFPSFFSFFSFFFFLFFLFYFFYLSFFSLIFLTGVFLSTKDACVIPVEVQNLCLFLYLSHHLSFVNTYSSIKDFQFFEVKIFFSKREKVCEWL